MKLSLSHPLWTHLPATAALAVFVSLLAAAGPLPARAPTHFGPGGLPDEYGSPAGVFALIIGLSVMFILLTVWMDETWSRQERQKRFNYFTLLDEIVVSAMAGIAVGYLRDIQMSQPVYTFPAVDMLAFAVPTVGAAILLEKARPFNPMEESVVPEDTTALRKELERRLKSSAALAYSDIQNPLYMNLLAAGVPAALLISTAFAATAQPLWTTILNVTLALLLASLHGGMRTLITRDRITVRFGTPGFRVLRLSTSEVTEIALRPFLPLQEFGGYGIRRNSRMSGYFLKGGVGVEIGTARGRRVLLGSEHPERLAEVIAATAGLPATLSPRG